MCKGMSKLNSLDKTQEEVPMIRTVGDTEFRGIIAGTIPVCDLFGEYDANGLAIVQKNGKVGVANLEPSLVLLIEYEDVEILLDGNIMALKDNEFYLYDKYGKLITRSTTLPEIKL